MPFLDSGVMEDDDEEQQRMNPIIWHKLHISKSKLKNSSRTSALLAGFAMVALVEFDLTAPGGVAVPVHPAILIGFGVCTTLLVSVHLLALMMSVCALPHMEAVTGGADIRNSPHESLRCSIEVAWLFSTVLGLLLFLAEIGLICWIKFAAIQVIAASYATMAVLIPVLIIFLVFTRHFYQLLYKHRRNLVDERFNDLCKSYECLNKAPSNMKTNGTIIKEVDETRKSYLCLQEMIDSELLAIDRNSTPNSAKINSIFPTIPAIFVEGHVTPVNV